MPQVLEELIDNDAANAVILIPGGLGEKKGSEEIADALATKIRRAHETDDGGPVFIGGNSLGVISHPGRYDTMFIPETKLAKSRGDHPRSACFISQSGAYIIANLSRMPWFDPAYALSIGNQIDLTAADLLQHIKNDPEIDVFAVYMEGFKPGDGLVFAQAVRDTVALGKDVVFYKAGRTTRGAVRHRRSHRIRRRRLCGLRGGDHRSGRLRRGGLQRVLGSPPSERRLPRQVGPRPAAGRHVQRRFRIRRDGRFDRG